MGSVVLGGFRPLYVAEGGGRPARLGTEYDDPSCAGGCNHRTDLRNKLAGGLYVVIGRHDEEERIGMLARKPDRRHCHRRSGVPCHRLGHQAGKRRFGLHRLPDQAFAIIDALPKIKSKGGLLFTTTAETTSSGWSRATICGRAALCAIDFQLDNALNPPTSHSN